MRVIRDGTLSLFSIIFFSIHHQHPQHSLNIVLESCRLPKLNKSKDFTNSWSDNGEEKIGECTAKNDVTKSPEIDTAPTFRNISSSRGTASKDRQVSLKELASFLDRDRVTVTKLLDHGLPFAKKADRDLGKVWCFDTAEVVRWLEKRAADTAAEKFGVSGLDRKTSEEEAKRRRAVAAAIIAELEAAEAVKTVVRISYIVDRIATGYAEIRSRLMTYQTL